MLSHKSVSPKLGYVSLNKPGDGHHMIIPDLTNDECERNDYQPDPKLSTPRINTGFIKLTRQISRENMPTGHPNDAPNLVQTRVACGISVDELAAANSFNQLAHVPN